MMLSLMWKLGIESMRCTGLLGYSYYMLIVSQNTFLIILKFDWHKNWYIYNETNFF